LPHAGEVRTGGFGGAEGLARFLRESGIDLVIDATHPFAARISRNAVEAAGQAGVPLIALERPAWEQVPGDRWILVDGVEEAAAGLGDEPRRVFLAIGRQHLAPFKAKTQHFYIVRSVDPVDPSDLLPNADYIQARGPFAELEEQRLLAERGVDLVVSRDSGGDAAYGKIAAARALGISVIMIRRPSIEARRITRSVEETIELANHLVGLAAARGE